jgi:WD40 repeat protein
MLRLWDAKTGASRGILEGHLDWVRSLSFSPNSKLLASASDDYTVRLWDAQTGVSQGVLEGHSNGVTAVAFSADGHLLASASEDHTVRLWNWKPRAIKRILQFDGKLKECFFSAQGSYLVTNIGEKAEGHEEGPMRDLPIDDPYIIAVNGAWLTVDAERLLWLPQDYRPGTVAGYNIAVAIGSANGRVIVLQFNFQTCRKALALIQHQNHASRVSSFISATY